MNRLLYRVCVLLSVLLVGLALWRLDYLALPRILAWTNILFAVPLCCAGGIASALAWRSALREVGLEVSRSTCIAAIGLSIFGKYIPGKVWSVVGRSTYIGQMTGESVGRLSAVSLSLQIATIWIGLGLGIAGLVLSSETRLFGMAAAAWLVLTVMLIATPSDRIQRYLIGRLGIRAAGIQLLTARRMVSVVPWQFACWGCWSLGFLYVRDEPNAKWMRLEDFSRLSAAASLGIVAIVFPGGLGVREGVLTAYLVSYGIMPVEAAGIAVAARLWFMVGEVFMFCCGAIAHFSCNVTRSKASSGNDFEASKSPSQELREQSIARTRFVAKDD